MNALRDAVAAVMLLALVHCAFAADLPATFDPSRDAAADVAEAVALAKAQGKRVIVDVGGEWCTWCHIMDRFIAGNADVRALIDARFVWVKVNFSRQNSNDALLSRWPKVAGYPHLFVLDADGTLVHSQNTGELEGGRSYDKARFVAFLDRWAPRKPDRAAVPQFHQASDERAPVREPVNKSRARFLQDLGSRRSAALIPDSRFVPGESPGDVLAHEPRRVVGARA